MMMASRFFLGCLALVVTSCSTDTPLGNGTPSSGQAQNEDSSRSPVRVVKSNEPPRVELPDGKAGAREAPASRDEQKELPTPAGGDVNPSPQLPPTPPREDSPNPSPSPVGDVKPVPNPSMPMPMPMPMPPGPSPAVGPKVDRSQPRLYSFQFTAKEADAAASDWLGQQTALLNTNVAPRGKLVIYLHGAGKPGVCGVGDFGTMLTDWGFHVFAPCYAADYGVGNCGNNLEGCRLEALEGVDRHPFLNISVANSLESRIVKGLTRLQQLNPQGDWLFFVDDQKPRWSEIIVSGHSHGASAAALIATHRLVSRSVSLAGPRDTNQAWLKKKPLTPIDRFFAFTHQGDSQYEEHLAAFESLQYVGAPTSVDMNPSPYKGSHRLTAAGGTNNGHSAVNAGGASPKVNGKYAYEPVWRYLFVGAP